MNWGSASEFFAMGGYGLYVWGAYAVTFICLVVEPVLAALRHHQAGAALMAGTDEAAAMPLHREPR